MPSHSPAPKGSNSTRTVLASRRLPLVVVPPVCYSTPSGPENGRAQKTPGSLRSPGAKHGSTPSGPHVLRGVCARVSRMYCGGRVSWGWSHVPFVAGAELAPARDSGDRKGRPYMGPRQLIPRQLIPRHLPPNSLGRSPKERHERLSSFTAHTWTLRTAGSE